MGWTFHSFDPVRWGEWAGGALTPERHAKLSEAVLSEYDEGDSARQQLSVLVDLVARAGFEAAYRQSNEAAHAWLDQLLCLLFTREELADDLDVKGFMDPWGWNAIAALVNSLDDIGAARLLLTGRRLVTEVAPKEPMYVLFTMGEAAQLAEGLLRAVSLCTPASAKAAIQLPPWEVEALMMGLTELGQDIARGRPVFAHFG